MKEDKSFNVHINQGEMYQIQEWVSKHQKIETGGDLFGLWLDDHTAVVQFVLGPGKKCRRTETSFFQDVEYLQQAGSYLTDKHGLCNIGQWHSHHRLSLSKPSHGDENTVWGNMPVLGLTRYIVFIANITYNKVTVNGFLFHCRGRKRSLTKGQFKYLDGNSPLRLNGMVLRNTFDRLERFIQPALFESEMKFLRNNDDNIETSTGDKEQNAEHEKCTTPNKRKEENCKNESPKEQSNQTSMLERLRDNDTKDDNMKTYAETNEQSSTNTSADHEQYNRNSLGSKNAAQDKHDTLCKSNMGTCPEKKARDDTSTPVVDEQYNENFSRRGNVQENRKDDNAKAYTKNVSVGHEQEKSNVPRRHQDEKNDLGNSNEDNNENYKGNENQYDASIFIRHEQPNRRNNDEKYDAHTFKKDNIKTKTEIREQSNTHIFNAHEQNKRNSLRRDNDEKDNNVILKDDNAETSNENSKKSNANTSFESEQHTGNTEQYDKRVSVEEEKDNRNYPQGDNDKKDNKKILEDDNAQIYTENRDQWNAHISFEPGQHNRNYSRGDNDKEGKLDISNDENIETRKGNTVQDETSVSVDNEQDNRNYSQGDNDKKDNKNILKDDNAQTYTENRDQWNAHTSFEPRQHNRNSSRGDNDKEDTLDISNEDNMKTRTRSADVSNSIEDEQQNMKFSRDDKDAKDYPSNLNENNIGTSTENTEQHDISSSAEDRQRNSKSIRDDEGAKDHPGTLNKNFTGNKEQFNVDLTTTNKKENKDNRTCIVNREQLSTAQTREVQNHKNESLEKVLVTKKFFTLEVNKYKITFQPTRNGQDQTEKSRSKHGKEDSPRRQTPSETHQHSLKNHNNETRSNTYEQKQKEKTETSVSTSPLIVKAFWIPAPEKRKIRNENAGTQQPPRPTTNEETAHLTSNASSENYYAYGQQQQVSEYEANSTNWQTEQKQNEYRRKSARTTGYMQQDQNVSTNSKDKQHLKDSKNKSRQQSTSVATLHSNQPEKTNEVGNETWV